VSARFLERAIRQAEDERAQCLIVQLDTPGGLADSARSMVKSILGSRTCVVIYVAPSGARAASAGVFITLAGHVAAMAPGTTIGAAHPVEIGGLPGSPPAPESPKSGANPMEEKIVNDTVAWARALAELRGRNADWAARSVKESLSVTNSEALKEKIVDLVAADVPELLQRIDGRKIALADGGVTLKTAHVREIRTIDMWWGEKLLAQLANPNIAFLLLVFGFYGILFELYSPGWYVAGVLGAICLVLGFFGLAVLPINYVGLALLVLGLGLFAADLFVTSHGAVTLGGIVCLVMGALMLVESPRGFGRVSLAVIVPVAAGMAAVTLFLVSAIVRTHRQPVLTGGEALIGLSAVAADEFLQAPGGYRGIVRVRGELWKAICSTPVAPATVVAVKRREGLTLTVEMRGEPIPPIQATTDPTC
jgi:membrane-bound serine protease (ClpP class)